MFFPHDFRDQFSHPYRTRGTGEIIINKLTAERKILLKNLKITQLVEKLSDFYGTRRFITMFT
jgi:hypothetical protein